MTLDQPPALHVDPVPAATIAARVNIHHLQLRDLLQPTGCKDKVLFVSRLSIDSADFAGSKPASTYCTLDFQPNCLATGCGLLAAGGQHGELALRPLQGGEQVVTPWLLRTPTGGSINNAISVRFDSNAKGVAGGAERKVVKADVVDAHTSWAARDGPSYNAVARPGVIFGDAEMESELSQSVFDELAAAYGFDSSSHINRSSRRRSTPPLPPPPPAALEAAIKVMVSNNDQSIKLYKLRAPTHHSTSGLPGLPGLSRNTTLHFSTAINHSSLSPDQRTLIAVGDTPEVFIHSVSRSGEHTKLATYTASSDACFSTTWSPDGSKFAVASQDGVVSVWDVRSSRRLAAVSTSQANSASGAARVVKFSPCGRWLAFTEHRNAWGLTDTVTFGETQCIAAPKEDGWVDRRREAAEERFRLVTGGDEAIARDRERRNMIHATFMREWNRAINLVDRDARSGSDWAQSPTAAQSLTSVRREDLLSAALTPTTVGRESSSINISGLCWDPDAEHVYVSTERVIAKYNVVDTRLASADARLL